MNPLRWVRWKVVGVLAILFGLVYFLGLDTVALSQINTAGKESRAARWSIEDFALGLFAGSASFSDLLVGTPERSKDPEGATDKVFNVLDATVNVSVTDFLRRRYVVDQLEIQAPRMTLSRRADGTMNIEHFGAAPEETTEPAAPGESTDWLGTIEKWYERLQKVREKLPAGGEKKKTGEKKPGEEVGYSRGVTYPYAGRPSVIVRHIVGSNLEVDFQDASSSAKIPPLTNGTIEFREVTSGPSVQKEPTQFSISGEIAGSKLQVKGTVDFRGENSSFKLDADTGDLPASLIEAFVGASLPVKLQSGTVRVKLQNLILEPGKLNLEPALTFKGVHLEPKDAGGKIAGVDATQFTTALNAASQELDEIVIKDLKITGSLGSPRFEWGDTVKNLVVSWGKDFAKKQAAKGIEKGQEALDKELEKLPVDGELKETLKKVKIDDALDIFGGGKKKKE
jgi:hypothetical protein